MTDIQQARKWAHDMHRVESECGGVRQDTLAAAEVIQSLPDQIIDAEEVRELVVKYEAFAEDAETEGEKGRIRAALYRNFVGVLEALLTTPPLPTLADMTQEEREACRLMQAQTWYEVGIIVWVDEMTEIAQLITRANGVLERKFKDVTPLPDLPKLEWPGSAPDDVAYATGGALTTQDVVDECRAVRKERALPRPEDVPEGEPWIVRHYGKEWVGVRADEDRTPWSITRMDGMVYRDVDDSEITLVSRLVPEVTP